MSMLVVILALGAGALGAALRYAASTLIGRTGANLPLAVLLVNVVGSLVGGVVIGLAQSGAVSSDARLIVLSGFAGGLTTFSTFSVDLDGLLTRGEGWRASVYLLGNVGLGLAAAVAGRLVGR